MTDDEIEKAADLIRARRAIDKLREDDLTGLRVALIDDDETVYETKVVIPADVIALGLHKMAEDLTRQIGGAAREGRMTEIVGFRRKHRLTPDEQLFEDDSVRGGAAEPKCGCRNCLRERGEGTNHGGVWFPAEKLRMVVCASCGNKRCPHATDHRLACTGSNDPGQADGRSGGPAFWEADSASGGQA